jgi:hypothetical protein
MVPMLSRPCRHDEIAVVVIHDHDLHGDHPRLPIRWLNAAARQNL